MIKSGTTVVSAYDTYGNLLTNPETGTTAGVVALAYDLADRTTSITPAGGTASTLVLDALGRVKTRTTGASVDTYSYSGPTNNVVRIANAGGSGTTTDSIVDPSGVRFGTKTGATVAWLLADLHGSVAVGLNQAGTTVTDALRYGCMCQVPDRVPVPRQGAYRACWTRRDRVAKDGCPGTMAPSRSQAGLAGRSVAPWCGRRVQRTAPGPGPDEFDVRRLGHLEHRPLVGPLDPAGVDRPARPAAAR